MASSASAAEPITYRQALASALEANPTLARTAITRAQAESSLRASRGQFDPTFGLTGDWRRSQSRGFFQGFPFESESRTWDFGSSLAATAATGTSVSVNGSLDRNFSSFRTDFVGGTQENIQDAFTSNLNVSVTQQLLKGLKLAYNMQNVTVARQSADVAELDVDRQRQQTLADTAKAYWNWQVQVQLLEIAEQSEAVAAEALRVGRLQVTAGQLAPVEGTRLDAAHVQASQNTLDARYAAQQAGDVLLLLMGRTPGAQIEPATKAGALPNLDLDVEAAVEVAMAQNVELAITRNNAAMASVLAKNAKHALLPTLSATVSAGVGAQDTTAGAAISGLTNSDSFPFVGVGGRFDVPIGNRAARGEAQRAGLTVQQRAIEVAEQERQVAANVRQQVRVLTAAVQKVALADKQAQLAQQTLEAEEALAKAGRAIPKDVLEARTEVARTATEAARARSDWRVAEVELLRLQGQLTDQLP